MVATTRARDSTRGMSYTRRRHRPGEVGQERAEPGIGARIGENVETVGEHPPVAGATDRDRLPLGAALQHPGHVLRAGLAPAHRPSHPFRQPSHERELGVGADLRAEPATHVRGDHPQPRGLDAQPARDLVARGLGVLRRAPQRQPPVVAPLRRGRARLERRGGEPLVDQLGRDHRVAPVEQVLVEGLVQPEAEHGVGARLLEHQHVVASRVPHVDHRGQRVVVDGDELRGVGPLVGLLGEHGHDRLADEADLVGREEGPQHRVVADRRRLHRLEVDLGTGHDVDHTRRRTRLRDVDGRDPGVRHGAAHEREVQRPRQRDVRGVGAAAGEEDRVLGAHDPRTHDAHESSSLALVGRVRGAAVLNGELQARSRVLLAGARRPRSRGCCVEW